MRNGRDKGYEKIFNSNTNTLFKIDLNPVMLYPYGAPLNSYLTKLNLENYRWGGGGGV